MVLSYFSGKDDRYICSGFFVQRNKVRHFDQPVNDYPELVESFLLW